MMYQTVFHSSDIFTFSPFHLFSSSRFTFLCRHHWALASQIFNSFNSFLPPSSIRQPLPHAPPASKVRFLTRLQKKQSAPKSLHFYSYKCRFRGPCSSLDTHPEWPFDWQLFPLYPDSNKIQKHTPNWLESPAVQQKQTSEAMGVDFHDEHRDGRHD